RLEAGDLAVEVLDDRHEVMDPLSVGGQELVVDVRACDRLEQPEDPAVQRRQRDPHREVLAPAPVGHLLDQVGAVGVDAPGADPEQVVVAAQRRLEVAHDDPDLVEVPDREAGAHRKRGATASAKRRSPSSEGKSTNQRMKWLTPSARYSSIRAATSSGVPISQSSTTS